MTELIVHRRNRTQDLLTLHSTFGAEIDVRSLGSQLILSHDPFSDGEPLDVFLAQYAKTHAQGLLIVNTKEDGLERAILDLLSVHGLKRFFFLDTALPTLVRLVTKENEKRLAIRVSEYEPLIFAEGFKGLVSWVWLDCFKGVPPELATVMRLKEFFKVCLVSPELQGYPQEAISAFRTLGPVVDAVCTKFPERWE